MRLFAETAIYKTIWSVQWVDWWESTMRTLVALCLFVLILVSCHDDRQQTSGPVNFVASKEREPYHRPSCRWAKKIDAANLETYSTRDEAQADGHRPCKVCKP